MFRKTIDAVFVIVAIAMLAFPLVTIGLVHLSVDFPDEIPIGNDRSQLEGRKYASFKSPTVETYTSRAFQKNAEKYISDHIPLRDGLLLFDAAQQRLPISLSASLFGYQAYPTFYGSQYYAVPGEEIVLEQSSPIPSSKKEIDKWVDLLNRTAADHPEVRMSVNYVLEPKHDSMNPTYALFGGDGLIDGEWVQHEFLDRQDEALSGNVIGIGSIENMKESWFTTDHHWNLKAALNAYNEIAEVLDLEKRVWETEKEIVFTDKWQGTAARSGRDFDYSDWLIDQSDDFSNLKYYKLGKVEPGSEIVPGKREVLLEQMKESDFVNNPSRRTFDGRDIYTAAYSTYYGGQNLEIINTGNSNGRTCLFIGDSFSRCLYRYIANNYERTIYILPGNYSMDQKLSDYFDLYAIDDMIIVVHAEKYGVILDESPNFFK